MRKLYPTPLLFFFFLFISLSNHGHDGINNSFHFTENKGQFPENVLFHCDLHMGDLFLEKDRFTFDFYSITELNEFYQIKHSKKN